MLAALTSADALTWMSILVKAAAYAATLLAAGSVLVLCALGTLDNGARAAVRKTAIRAAGAAAVFSVSRIPLRAGFLMGGTLDGAIDPALLRMVAESPLGHSVALRLAGLALIIVGVSRSRPFRARFWLALAGAVLAAASFALRGHALGEPRAILGGLITLHILGLAFWIGALPALARAARTEPPAAAGALAREFGATAIWVVAALVGAGGAALALFGAATPVALETAYGQMFLVKLTVFAAVLALAAINKLRLTPALAADMPGAGARLRRSIGIEACLIAVILIVTATLTTLTAPPRAAASDRVSLERPALARHAVSERWSGPRQACADNADTPGRCALRDHMPKHAPETILARPRPV